MPIYNYKHLNSSKRIESSIGKHQKAAMGTGSNSQTNL